MNPASEKWAYAYLKTLGAALALIIIIIGAQGFADRIERTTEDRLAYQRWVTDACIPTREGQRAVATHDGARLRCTIYSTYDRGLAPVVVSAAVMDVPQ